MSTLDALLDGRLVRVRVLFLGAIQATTSAAAARAAELAMQFEQLAEIKAWLLDHLDLANVDIRERIEA